MKAITVRPLQQPTPVTFLDTRILSRMRPVEGVSA